MNSVRGLCVGNHDRVRFGRVRRGAHPGRQGLGQGAEVPDQMGGLEHRYLYPLAHWELIDRHADMRDIDPWVVVSLIRQESAFNPMAKSHANALGLMQMIPPVAKKEARLLQMDGFRPEDTFQPYVAVKLGVHHLARLFRQFDGSFICSFASYNAGSGPVKKWLDYYSTDFPLVFVERISYSETRNYVKKIIRNFVLYNRIYKDADVKVASLFKMPGGIGLSRLLSYENSRRISSE